jgi:hypothetical protein
MNRENKETDAYLTLGELRYRVCDSFINKGYKEVCWHGYLSLYDVKCIVRTLCALSKYEPSDLTYHNNGISVKNWWKKN